MTSLVQLAADLNSMLLATTYDPYREVCELLARRDALVSADERGVVIQEADATHRIDLPVGLTEKHYWKFAPLLDEDEQGLLALGVLKAILRPMTWYDWEIAKTVIEKNRMADDSDDGWLTEKVSALGFGQVATELAHQIADYKKMTPKCRIKLMAVEKPVWDGRGGVLSFGDKTWRFKLCNGPVVHLLDELERQKWPRSVHLKYLNSDQVREAAKGLRKTRPVLGWRSSDDGYLSWFVM